MNKNKIIILFSCLILIFSGYSIHKEDLSNSYINANKNVLEAGEELTYIVKYLFISIGEIKLKINKIETENEDTVYHTIAYIDSYDGLPFVNLHQVYESNFNQKIVPRFFKGTIYDDDTTYTRYNFDHSKKSIHVLKGNKSKNKIWTDSTARLDKIYQDGLSLFYFARMNSRQKKTISVPCFINENSENTVINFYNESDAISIDAVDYDISCVYLDGETEFKGIFGLTGYFEGWFSNDKYAVPIAANMSVIIGNISVELMNWKKKSWKPPKYQD